MKKLIATVLVVALIASSLSFAAFASSETETTPDITIAPYEQIISQYANLDEFYSYITKEMQNCNEQVDVSDYEFPLNEEVLNALMVLILDNVPVLFHVDKQFSYSSYGSTIHSLNFVYKCSEEEYRAQLEDCEAVADKLLSGIENNASLTDVEKALLIHDRLAVWCEYDTQYNGESHCMRRALLERNAVCDGYSSAYAYLLRRVGIESDICLSDLLHHAWNIVYIDGEAYHVDVTWDDKVYDVTGKVNHENFLRSTNGIVESGHHFEQQTDFDTRPESVTYDSYFWQNSNSEMQLIGNSIYYVDHTTAQLKIVGNQTPVTSVESVWYANANNAYWPGNYARLSSDGRYLFYSLYDSIYEYDTVKGTAKKVVSINPQQNNYFGIYGMTYEDGYLIYNTFNTPSYDWDTASLYTVKVLYPEVCNHSFTNGVCQNCDAVISFNGASLTQFDSSMAGEIAVPLKVGSTFVTTIGESAFENATRLTAVTVPDSVSSISKNAFKNCSRLEKITVHDSVTTIADDAFDGVGSNFKICCYKGSPASLWAQENGYSVEIIPIPYGNVDGNENIDIFDLVSLAKHVVGSNDYINTRAANVNAQDEDDRTIDVMDLVSLAKYVCGNDIQLGPKQ